MYFVYMIKDLLCRFYIGVSRDPNIRINIHNRKQGAKFTKFGVDFKIVFLKKYPTFKEARIREIQIKKWTRKKKEFLIKRFADGLSTNNKS